MDIESTGIQEVQQRERNPTERGQAYNAESRKPACLSLQKKLTGQINRVDSTATGYDNSRNVQRELDIPVAMQEEL